MTHRVSAVELGPALRVSIERALDAEPSRLQLRLFLAALHRTATWSRLEDKVALAELAQLVRVSDRTARRGLAGLNHAGILAWLPGSGRGNYSTVSLAVDPAVGPLDEKRTKNGRKADGFRGDRGDQATASSEEVQLASWFINKFEELFGRPGAVREVDKPRLERAVALLGRERAGALLTERAKHGAQPRAVAYFLPALEEKAAPLERKAVGLQERCERWVDRVGWDYPDDALVADELRLMGVDDPALEAELLERAHQRRLAAAAGWPS